MLRFSPFNPPTAHKRGKGNPIFWPPLHTDEMTSARKLDISLGLHQGVTDKFLKWAMMNIKAKDYVLAHFDCQASDEILDELFWSLKLERQTSELPEWSFNPYAHFNALASIVVEECRYVLSELLAARWLESTFPVKFLSKPRELHHKINKDQKTSNTCPPMKMNLLERARLEKQQQFTKLHFQLPDGHTFHRSQQPFLRAGTIVECLPDGEHKGLKSVILGVVASSHNSNDASSGQLTIHTTDLYFGTHIDVTKWVVQPLASFVSEMRQIEACLALRRGEASPAFLGPYLGRRPCIDEMKDKNAKRNRPPSPTSVTNGPYSTTQKTSMMESTKGNTSVQLNRSQVKAALDFVESAPGSITCVQGPPGSGKTTLLVATILEYLHRKFAKENSTVQGAPLMVTAPTNKATMVVGTRCLITILQHIFPNNYRVKIALVGDDSKLKEDDVHDTSEGEGSVDIALAKMKHWNVYNFLPSVLFALEHLQKAMENKPDDFQMSSLPDYDQYIRFFERLDEVARFFKKDVRARAQKLLKRVKQKSPSEGWRCSGEEDLKKIIGDIRGLSQDHKIKREVSSYLLRTADVIFCTLATTGASIFRTNDQVMRIEDLIVDEASCATEAEIAIPFRLNPSRVMFVGDPKQLPATVRSPKAREFLLDRSIQERLTKIRIPSTLLNQQYRMRPEIAAFASKQFYEEKLKNAPKVIKAEYKSPLPLLKESKGPFHFQQVQGKAIRAENGSWQNEEEAEEVVQWILKLQFKAKAQNDSTWFSSNRVRIITFYNAQVNLINSKLMRFGFGTQESGLLATTVDSSQGCEADCVIVSFVRNCDGAARATAGFLNDDRRINVALTRARFELICVGNRKNMMANDEIKTLQAFASHARQVKRERKKRKKLAAEEKGDESSKRRRLNSVSN